jgi:predicted TIM-barrel fold metal-dependent hydrolase
MVRKCGVGTTRFRSMNVAYAPAMTEAGRIDVHAHFVPPAWRAALEDAGLDRPDGMPGLPPWDTALALEAMDQAGIATAILSITSPGVHVTNDDRHTIALARTANESAAEAARDHPGRFGGFASLPLPNVDAALSELEYALDELELDGVVLMTNVDGMYLGDPSHEPLFAELDRRGAAVFVHPTSPACSDCTSLGYARPLMEFVFDTARTIMHLILSGALAKYPNMKIVVPHSGGALPVLADRVGGATAAMPGIAERAPHGITGHLQRLWYDVALSTSPIQIAAVRGLVGPDRLMFGTDWPMCPIPRMLQLIEQLETNPTLTADDLAAINRGTAASLFAKFG